MSFGFSVGDFIAVSTASHQNQFMIPKEVAKFQTTSFEYQTLQPPTSEFGSTTIVVGENGLQKSTRDTMKVDGSNQTHKQQDLSENTELIDESNAETYEIPLDEGVGRRQLAEQDAIKALTALKLLPPPPEPEKKPPEKTKPLKFKDAGMEELIRQAFLHVEIIGPHVAEGHYDLVGPNGDIILPQVWETVVEPDWTVTMHMWPIPEKPSTPEPEPPVEIRPRVLFG
ncbi:hypothetical protein ZTR_08954 [Talaromyces verruculosus]|nr:hypothetical protein ZTR_08954 [Talaromyces verruculosus]